MELNNDETQFLGIVRESTHYQVQVVKLKETSYNTYGVVNKDTMVIEGVQPVLSQAWDMMETFEKWLTEKIEGKDKNRSTLKNVFEQTTEG